VILGESFQRMRHGSWVAQYTLVRRETNGNVNDLPSHQYRFDAIFRTKSEADAYALRRAKERIDKN
jgi:hypothetical protein